MSHGVLVPAAHRFVQAFYGELAHRARVDKAMLAGQQVLLDDSYRDNIMGAVCLYSLRVQAERFRVLHQPFSN